MGFGPATGPTNKMVLCHTSPVVGRKTNTWIPPSLTLWQADWRSALFFLPMLYLYFRSIYLFHVIPSSCLSPDHLLVHNTYDICTNRNPSRRMKRIKFSEILRKKTDHLILARRQSSSYHAACMDLPDPLSQPVSIIYRSREVFKAISWNSTELLYIGFRWSSCLCPFM